MLSGLAAALTRIPECQLSDEEAGRLGIAWAEVRRYWTIPLIDPKYVALAGFLATAGMIAKGKVAAYQDRLQASRKPVSASPAPAPSNGAAEPVNLGLVDEPGWFMPDGNAPAR